MSIKCEGSEESVELHSGRWPIQRPLARGKQSYTLFEGRHSSFSEVPLLCAAKLVMFSVRNTPGGSERIRDGGDDDSAPASRLKYYHFRSRVALSSTLSRTRAGIAVERNASRRLRYDDFTYNRARNVRN